METLVCRHCSKIKILNRDNFYYRGDNGKFDTMCIICTLQKTINYKNSSEKKYKKEQRQAIRKLEALTNLRMCNICFKQKTLNINNFYFREDNEKFRKECIDCFVQIRQNKIFSDPEIHKKIKNQKKQSATKNKEKNNEKVRKKRKENKIFALRETIRKQIQMALKSRGKKKNGHSFTKYLGYTIEDLKKHIESLFEPWMTWENKGQYIIKTWNDDDQSTWTWNLDHIIPQSEFKFKSMEDEEFKKCWALDNLRPYSAKQNIIDGSSKIRHGVTRAL